jgi:hypothetical protein
VVPVISEAGVRVQSQDVKSMCEPSGGATTSKFGHLP